MDAAMMNGEAPTPKYDADGSILKAACDTPLPGDIPANSTPAPAQTANEDPKSAPQAPKRARRNQAPSFGIFVDPESSRPHKAKKTNKRKDGRTPLGMKTDSANSSPAPSPRTPGTPYSYNAADPLWADTENFTEPSAPPTPAQTPRTPRTPPLGPQPRRARQSRPIPLRPVVPSAPRSMALYHLLELSDWQASVEVIKAAYKRVAIKYHPDKAAEEERAATTEKMQHINVAKEVLTDPVARAAYDKSGKLPWIA